MSQITGTITFSQSGLIYPEHLELSLCLYDSKGLKKYAKFESSKVFKDFTYEINFDERELKPATQHFIEIRYAGLSIHTLPADVSTLLTPDYDISFFNLNYKMELSGTVMTTRGVAINNNTVTLLRHELLELNSISSTTTDSSGYFQIIFSFPVSNILAFIDPDIYPSFLGNNYLDLQVKTIDPQNQTDPDVYSEIYYDVRNSLRVDFIIGNENLNDKPEYVKKQEAFNATSEFENLTLPELEQATTKTEYISKKLKSSKEEATHVIKTKYYKTKFSCDEEIMFALLQENVNRSYQDIMFTTSAKLKEEVNSANARNITNFVEGKGHTLDGAIATLKTNLIATYIAEPEVSVKLNLMGVSAPENRIAIVEATIDWKNDSEIQNNGTLLNDYLLSTGKISSQEYQKAEVYEKVAKVSMNSTDLSVAVLEDTSLNWASVDDIIAAKDGFETLITGYLNTSAISLPEGISDAAEYAKHMTKQLEIQYPSQFLKYEIKKPGATLFAGTNIATLLENNPNFQFGKSHGWATILDEDTDLTGLEPAEIEQLKTDLQEAEQIFKLTPEENKSVLAGIMKTKDFTSAYKIAGITRTSFIDQMRNELPLNNDVTDEELTRIHALASCVSNAAALDMMNLGIGQVSSDVSVIPSYTFNSQDTTSGFPSVYELFGSQDYFEYPKCRTIFSQAAYFTDILNFLNQSGKTTALFNRRPDLKHILLNCKNTDNVLPYIDLVNEILEREVLELTNEATLNMSKLQTTWSEQELAAYPENFQITKEAYSKLRNAIAPWSLPFHLPLEEFRTYLKTLGLSRREIIESFSPIQSTSGFPISNELLFESIGLSTNEISLITTPISTIEVLETVYPGITSVVNISDPISTGNVKQLINCSCLSYDEINDLLESYFINPPVSGKRYFTYTIPGYNEDINDYNEDHPENQIVPGTLETTFLLNNTEEQSTPPVSFYDRLHRFERLRRKLGLEVYQLDLIISYLGCNTLGLEDVLKIANFYRIKETLNLKLEEALLIFGNFSIGKAYSNYTNLFDFIFLKKSENYALRESFERLISNETITDPTFKFNNLQTILPFISGIKITEQQYNNIIAKEGYTLTAAPQLSEISRIIRVAFIIQALNISENEFYFLHHICGFSSDIFSVTDFTKLVETTASIKSYGLSISDLAFILNDDKFDDCTIYIDNKQIVENLKEIQEELKPINQSYFQSYVNKNTYNLFKTNIDTALHYIFDNITAENLSTIEGFIDAQPDLFHQFSTILINNGTSNVSLKQYFTDNRADTSKKLKAVLIGLGLATAEEPRTPGKFRTIVQIKDLFIKIKFEVLNKILLMSEDYQIRLPLSSKQDFKRTSAIQSNELYNVIPQFGIIDLTDLSTNTFITNNSSAFNFGQDTFLYPYTENPGLITDNNLRYKTYVYKKDLSVFDERMADLRTYLMKYLDIDQTETALKIISGNFSVIEMTEDEIFNFAEEYFSEFMPIERAINLLLDDSHDDYLENYYDRFDVVLNYFKQDLKTDIVISYFSEKFEINEETINRLLFDYITLTEGTNITQSIQYFLTNEFLTRSEITEPNSATEISIYNRIYKAIQFIKFFKLNPDVLNSIWEIISNEDTQSSGTKFKITNIFNIEVQQTINDSDIIDRYLNLNNAIAISHTYFADKTDFFTFFITNSDLSLLSTEAKSYIFEITGLKEIDFNALNPENSQLPQILPQDLFINWYNALLKCQFIMKHLGTNAQTIIDLNKTDTLIEFEHSEMLRQIVKNKYSEEEWYSIAETLRNPLREKQRDALRDYLIIKNEFFENSYDLFYEYLIDPEMTNLVKTTRITQATLSVQLFIQRVLMGLEGNLSFNEDEKNELIWRKNYRVWEANRKILFFPENWLDPELRHNKSPFFKELEEKLMQNDIDDSSVLQAYYEYIDKLDEVSNLEILAAYRVGSIESESQTIHFIGRTHGTPYKFFYRKLVNKTTWTPWEEIINGIKADMVKLVYWKRNLYMFWPEVFVTNKVDESKLYAYNTDGSNSELLIATDGETTTQFTAVKMAWSVLKKGTWSKAVFSNDIYVEPQNSGRVSNVLINAYPYSEKIQVVVSFYNESTNAAGTRGSYIFNGLNLWFNYGADANPDWYAYTTRRKLVAGVSRSSPNYNIIENNTLNITGLVSSSDNIYNTQSSITFSFFTELPVVNNDYPDSNFNALRNSYPLFHICKQNEYSPAFLKYKVLFDNMDYYRTDWQLAPEYLPAFFKPFVLMDSVNEKTFLGIPFLANKVRKLVLERGLSCLTSVNVKYETINFYYSFIKDIRESLNNGGYSSLFKRSFQDNCTRSLSIEGSNFTAYYGADSTNIPVVPESEKISFYPPVSDEEDAPVIQDPYAIYNWELFYHIPMLIANNLSSNMKFEEAQKWYHLIFDPTIGDNSYRDENNNLIATDSAPKKYWKIRPFRDFCESETSPESPQMFMYLLSNSSMYNDLIAAWEDDPFNPHLIAEARPVAYMKNVVSKYIENLLGWGDMLFTKDTMEDINQAMLLYILAADILGIKPQKLDGTLPEEKSFNDIGNLDSISNAYDTITGILTVIANHNNVPSENPLNDLSSTYRVSYFGVPRNNKMDTYWDIVADRLFKIRHSMNIQGVLRELPLTAPPIDPGAVAAAIASGADLSSALSTLSAPMPLYRFNYMLQKAIEFTNDVKTLGNTMLSILEKKDAEEMSILRSSQEQIMLKAMSSIREKAITEATENINALYKSMDNTRNRYLYYKNKKFMNAAETTAISLTGASLILSAISSSLNSGAATVSLFPQISLGFPPYITYGGVQMAGATSKAANVLNTISYALQTASSISSTLGSYKQRKDDWDFQAKQADGEYYQLIKQLDASKVRLAMAQKELENHHLQIDQKKEEYEFMKSKFTNKQLYNWMKGEVSKLYQSAFQMAHKLALAAEKAYLFERQKDNYRSFITTAYWDNLREGLMAGELLYNDLRRLEMEYMETNSRDFELSKDIPLSMIDPEALIELQTTGTCKFDIPEMLYDIDHPGHYMRRIKAVSVSIPAVTGPYSGVTCKMSLLNNRFRKSTSVGNDGYAYKGIEDLRFVHNIIGIQSIATSTGNNDTGMFEFNFRDERYLPFEGAGAIGSWQIELPNTIRKFDYESISDVILHVKYTARDAGGMLKLATETAITNILDQTLDFLEEQNVNLQVAHSMKSEFADELYELINNGSGELKVELKHFPFLISDFINRNSNKVIKILSIKICPSRELNQTESLPILSCTSGSVNGDTIDFGDTGETLTSTGLTIGLSYEETTTPVTSDIYAVVSYKIA